MPKIHDSITIRPARPGDADALSRLAALDSAAPIAGEALLADVDGAIVAAVAVAGGRAIADPFRATADAVVLLDSRRAQLVAAQARAAGSPPRRRLRLGRPAAVAARAA